MKLYTKEGRRYAEADDTIIIAEALVRLQHFGMTSILSQAIRELLVMSIPSKLKEPQ